LIEVLDQTNQGTSDLDRAALFGDGFFTTGIIKDHQFYHQQQHFDRLIASAKALLFTHFELDPLKQTIQKLCQKHPQSSIRITVSRAQKQRGYSISDNAETICKIHLANLPKKPQKPCQLIDANTAISYNKTLAGIKHLNRLDSVLAASEISSQYQEVLMYHQDLVICGSRSNLFVKLDDVWQTPKLDYCGVLGITRLRVIKLFQQEKIDYQISDINRDDLKHADSAFVTNSLVGVWPVKTINKRELNIEDSNYIEKLVSI